jgi:hypothetical protein
MNYAGGMDPNTARRIEKLEEAVSEFRLALKNGVNTMIKWTVGTVLGSAVAAIAVMALVLDTKALGPLQCCPLVFHCPQSGLPN